MLKTLSGSDEQIEIVTKAFENLGLDFSTMIAKVEEDTEGTGTTVIRSGQTRWLQLY